MSIVPHPLSLLIAIVGCSPLAQSKPAADRILLNAKVWTVDRSRPHAQAVAVLGDRIAAVGSDPEIETWRGPIQMIDAGGKLVLPGFNAAHVHLVSGGVQLENIQLHDVGSAQEFARRIAERAQGVSRGQWILGGDWDEMQWTPAKVPTKALIDRFTPDTPVFLCRYDGHSGSANSVVLRLAGITSETPDPPGGVIVRDAKGNPTGVLRDAAMEYAARVIPPLTHEQRFAGREASAAFGRLGRCDPACST